MPVYRLEEDDIYFPYPELAEEDGLLADNNFNMIDCQFHTEHLESMGGVRIPWEEYKKILKQSLI